jgi:hypothetical protein
MVRRRNNTVGIRVEDEASLGIKLDERCGSENTAGTTTCERLDGWAATDRQGAAQLDGNEQVGRCVKLARELGLWGCWQSVTLQTQLRNLVKTTGLG